MGHRLSIMALRVVLGIGLVIALALQVLVLPWMSGWMAQDFPEAAPMRWPILTLSVLGLLCAQIVLIAIWRLLDAIQETRIFDPQSFGWVDVIVRALASAAALSVICLAYLLATALGPVSVPALALFASLVAVGMLLLMLVMRALLRQATTLRVDMEAVI